MSAHAPDKPATIVPFAPMSKGQAEGHIVADESGRTIVALLQKAAEMAKETAPAQWISPTSCRFNCAPPKKGPESSKRRPHISAIVPGARKRGCYAFIMRSSIHSFKRRTASCGKRHGSDRLSIDTPSGKSDASGGRHGFMLPWAKCALAGRRPTAIITALALFAFAPPYPPERWSAAHLPPIKPSPDTWF